MFKTQNCNWFILFPVLRIIVETENRDVPRQIGDLIAKQELIDTYANSLDTGEFGLKMVIKNISLLAAEVNMYIQSLVWNEDGFSSSNCEEK